MLFIILLIIIIVIIAITRSSGSSKNNSNTSIPTNIHSTQYRETIQNNTAAQYQENIRYLYKRLDALDEILKRNNRRLEEQSVAVAEEILRKAENAEQEISQHWQRNTQNADFYFYIGLHYTSFTLADKLTEELNALSEYRRIVTPLIKETQGQIDLLKAQIERNKNAYNIGTLKAQHRELCQKCDALRKSKNTCNEQYALIFERRNNQNRITAERREYIGSHFGAKGRNWRNKIMSKHRH